MWRNARSVTVLLVACAVVWRQTASPAQQATQTSPAASSAVTQELRGQVWIDANQNGASQASTPSSVVSKLDGSSMAWASYGDQTAGCVCKASPVGTLQPMGMHSKTVVAAVVNNISGRPLKLRLKAVLPAGTYTIDQLSIVAPTEPGVVALAPQVQRLQGVVLPRPGSVTKDVDLQPGEIAVYRFVNRAGRVVQSFRQLLGALHELAVHRPQIARPMRRALLHAHDSMLTLAYGHSREARLRAMHGVLLAGAQAEALELNQLAHHPHVRNDATAVSSAMTAYMDNAARVGAVLLGLVPQITTTVQAGVISVNIALANTGAHSVYGVKLAVHVSSLPVGVRPSPGDADYFGVLRPGQSAASVFRLKCGSIRPDKVAADVSYIAGGGPAQLLPLSWHITYPAAQTTASTSTR